MADILFIKKNSQPTPAVVPTPTPNTAAVLVATDIKTGIVSTTTLVTKNGVTIQILRNAEIVNWIVASTRLMIYSTDSDPITLTFLNNSEALEGESRLQQILNGATLS